MAQRTPGAELERDELLAFASASPAAPLLLLEFVGPITPRGGLRTATRQIAPPPPPIEEALRAPSLRIAVVGKARANTYDGSVFVGRATLCDVVLRDASVSKSHAVFEPDDDGWILRDNHSHNGTWLQGRRLAAKERAKLVSGAALHFGTCAAYFVVASELKRILETMVSSE